ncbi:MAG: dephospho-CoA kinase [Clostridia bacterium]|nr:dephospho-CoA kinase [Clostridia bacterium]
MKKKIIAITGGIASGKSTFSAILRDLEQVVYDADKIYAEIIQDKSVVLKIYELLGINIDFLGDGPVYFDRKLIADAVFNDEKLLQKLNNFTHKLVYEKISEIAKSSKEPFIFFEVPLLFESGGESLFDDVIIIMREKCERILGAMIRSNLTEDEVLKRMSAQVDYDNLDKSLHTVINNNEGLCSLKIKAEKVIDYYKKQCM